MSGQPEDIQAIDRRQLRGQRLPEKPTRWPRTGRRQARIAAVLARRQPDLTVVLEDVHDPHNVSAVLRSCDAVGILRAHAVYVEEEPPERSFARTSSGSAAKWVQVVRHDSLETCFAQLRAEGLRIVVTALEPTSVDLFETNLTLPTAIVFGNEMRGVTRQAVDMADGVLSIPMMGMVQSLNISVACAVTLYEALRQRKSAGMYEEPRLEREFMENMREDWLRR